jgi:hypothetical protein
MAKYRLRASFEATRWFPGVKIEGVVNDYPADAKSKTLCGCLMVGGPVQAHIHNKSSALAGYVLNPGDWIVKRSEFDDLLVCSDAYFTSTYERVPTPVRDWLRRKLSNSPYEAAPCEQCGQKLVLRVGVMLKCEGCGHATG